MLWIFIQNQKIFVSRFGRLCGVQFEELEMTRTSQNKWNVSTLAGMTAKKHRIPQSLHCSNRVVKPNQKEEGGKDVCTEGRRKSWEAPEQWADICLPWWLKVGFSTTEVSNMGDQFPTQAKGSSEPAWTLKSALNVIKYDATRSPRSPRYCSPRTRPQGWQERL